MAFRHRRQFVEKARPGFRGGWLDQLRRDVEYAWRSLRRSRGFATTAVGSLALGIGATTVIYAVVDHIAIRPLTYPDPDRLAVVREIVPDLASKYPTLPASVPAFLALRRQCRSCEDVVAMTPAGFTLSGAGDAERVAALRVSTSMFAMLGATPVLGRPFFNQEDQSGSDRVVILSDGLWRRRFGADRSVVGRTIGLNNESFVVVGVLPPTFRPPKRAELGEFLPLPADPALFVPLALTATEIVTPLSNNFGVLVRRRAGVTHKQMAAEISRIEASLNPSLTARSLAVVIPLGTQMLGSTQTALLLLLAAVGALLVMVALNLGSLFAARWARRSRESALRAAIGASRLQLVTLTMVESLLLAAIGGVVGIALSRWGLAALLQIAPATIPRLDEIRLDWRVSVVGLALAALVGLGAGAIPAIRAGRASPGDLLESGTRVRGGRAAGRAGRVLIGSQVGIGILLLATTGLLLASFVRVMQVDKGFASERVMTVNVVTPASYGAERRMDYFDQAIARLSAVAGVVGAGVVSTLPLSGEDDVAVGFGRANDSRPVERRPPVNIRYVSPSYFTVLGIPMLRGRAFGDPDRGQKVTVLSESAAAALWPGEDAVGKWLSDGQAIVIGVAADVRTNGLDRDVSPIVYVPHWFFPDRPASIVVKATGWPAGLASSIRAELKAVDPSVPISRVDVLDDLVSEALAERRFQLIVLGLFAATALIAASIGVYGVVAQWVSTRQGELGIRMALGASPSGIRTLVLREGLGPAAIGAAVGVGGALLVGNGLRSLLFGVQPTDLTVLGIATVVVASAAALACYLPARRAILADPVISLRSE